MNRLLLGVVTLTALSLSVVVASPAHPAAAEPAAAPPAGGLTFACSPLGSSIPLVCTITSFANTAGVLTATGTITNVVTGLPVAFTNVPVSNLSAGPGNSCRILHLVLGPIDLNALGLQVTTNQIVVDITGQRGPGNLLGNLLCGVAGLFDSPAPTDLLAGLLNFILQL